jgi:two-component system sensor histidine kinase BaeS
MRMGIRTRLFLSLLAATTVAVLCMFAIFRWSLDRGFLRFVNRMEESQRTRLARVLEDDYAVQGSWAFVQKTPKTWELLLERTLHDPGFDHHHPLPDGHFPPPGMAGPFPGDGPPHARPPFPPPDRLVNRLILFNVARQVVAGPDVAAGQAALVPLHHRQTLIGYLGMLPRRQISGRPETSFLREQKLAMGLVAGSLILISAAVSLALSRRLVQPLRSLVEGTYRLAAGEYEVHVPVESRDEFGSLAGNFNLLALTLTKNEQARRQWIADISHELRTPLSVLLGGIDALQEGVRQPTPATIQGLQDETLRLGRLVDDLYQLSLSDLGALNYRKTELDVGKELADSIDLFRPEFARKQIELVAALPDEALPVFADPQRLHQLFANLLDNALKYTDAGGRLEVACAGGSGRTRIDFRDSAPGVPDADLERLFERLYRVEQSRSRATGGAGLGLAICRNIVEAHGGTIAASSSPLGGLTITIELPTSGGNA